MPVCSKNRGNIIFCKPAVRCIMYIIPHSCRIYYVAKSGIFLVIVTHFV